MAFRAFSFLLLLMAFAPFLTTAHDNCTEFLNIYQDRIVGSTIPGTPVSDVSMRYCSNGGKSCCTPEVEEKLREISKTDYEKSVKKTLQNLSKMLKTKSVKFNEYFKELLAKSKKDFHEMFKRTYGMVYEQNSYVFSDFFTELERYFSYGKSNLADVMDTFFNILYQKMFTVMNGQYKFDDKYLGCVSEHMNELKPFGDVPQKLSMPLKRSFVAARTYAQSLNIAGDIVSNLQNMLTSESCSKATTKLLHCSSCYGIMQPKLCNNFCLNVMKGCLAFHSEVNNEWNLFVDAMSKVEQRLLGPFNIELVVEPINVKISEAIMNFQENANPVSVKVFNGCGKPPLLGSSSRRRRRQTTNGFSISDQFEETEEENDEDEEDDDEENAKNVKDEPNDKNEKDEITEPIVRQKKGELNRNKNEDNSGSSDKNENKRRGQNKNRKKDDYNLDEYSSSPVFGFLKLIREIGSQVTATKFFWKRLPYHVCHEEFHVDNNSSGPCWNGSSISSYDNAPVADGLRNQHTNPEVQVDAKKPIGLLNEQIYALKSVYMQLRNAFNGLDVEWIDAEEMFDSGTSGDGSGYGPDVIVDEEDDEDETGSGDTPPPTIFDIGVKRLPDNEASTVGTTTSGSTVGSTVGHTVIDITAEPTTESAARPVSVTTESTSTEPDFSFTTRGTVVSTVTVVKVSNNTNAGTRIGVTKMTLNRALASYLLPTVVIWIGGSFNDWFITLV